jgi:hypothetical protein
MKYPLSRFRCALLEIYCYFFGHKWKSSWRRNEIEFSTPDEDIPYALRQSGNQYWEYSAGWKYKCRRCRTHTRNDAHHPWYKVYSWAIKCSIRSFFSAIRFAREDGIKSRLWILPYAFLTATTQFFAHMIDQPHWPVFLLDVSCDLEMKLADRVFDE